MGDEHEGKISTAIDALLFSRQSSILPVGGCGPTERDHVPEESSSANDKMP